MTTSVNIPICKWCRHLHVNSNKFFVSCNAFPDRIPDNIWEAEFDHRFPLEEDRGIQFQKYISVENLPFPFNEYTAEQNDLALEAQFVLLDILRKEGFALPPFASNQ